MSKPAAARRPLGTGHLFCDLDGMLPTPQFVRFIAAGLLNTSFGYLVFALAVWLGASIWWSLVASTVAGIFFNVQTSRRIVFRSSAAGVLLPFTAVYGLVFSVDYVSVLLLQHVGLRALSAQAIMVLPMALLSYVSQSRFVFVEREATP